MQQKFCFFFYIFKIVTTFFGMNGGSMARFANAVQSKPLKNICDLTLSLSLQPRRRTGSFRNKSFKQNNFFLNSADDFHNYFIFF